MKQAVENTSQVIVAENQRLYDKNLHAANITDIVSK